MEEQTTKIEKVVAVLYMKSNSHGDRQKGVRRGNKIFPNTYLYDPVIDFN